MIICRSHGQVNEPTANTRIWLASSVNGSHDSTLLSGELFREALGVGLSKSLSHSWLFSPSVWYEAIETRQAAATSIESHFTVAWHHRFNTAWYLHAAPALELASDSPYPYLKPRVEIGRKLFNNQGATPFVSWEAAYRADGGYLDAFRVRAGFRILSRSGLEIVPMYDRRRGMQGTGTMNGATLVLLYVIPRTRHCNPHRSNRDDSRAAK